MLSLVPNEPRTARGHTDHLMTKALATWPRRNRFSLIRDAGPPCQAPRPRRLAGPPAKPMAKPTEVAWRETMARATLELASACRTGARWGIRLACISQIDRRMNFHAQKRRPRPELRNHGNLPCGLATLCPELSEPLGWKACSAAASSLNQRASCAGIASASLQRSRPAFPALNSRPDPPTRRNHCQPSFAGCRWV
jgi:hypothetical protein